MEHIVLTDEDRAREAQYYAEMRRVDEAVDAILTDMLADADEDDSEEGEADEPW